MTQLFKLVIVQLLLAALSGAATPCLQAQEPIRVSSDVVCADCVITIDTVLTLGGLEGEGMEAIGVNSAIAVDARERILIANALHPRIYVFDMGGRFLRTVGRGGEGPGEYSVISHINAGPQYIHVFQFYNGRTLLDHDFEFVRHDLFPGPVNQSFMTDSEVVAFATSIPTPASVGHKLHLLSPSGAIESYGSGESAYRSQGYSGAIVTGDGASLWSVEWDSTRVTRWDLLPKPAVARIWSRTIKEWDRHDRGPTGRAWPRPRNAGAMLDQSGLWIVWREPDPDWGGHPSEESLEITDPRHDIHDSWVELLDPDTGETLARYFDEGFLLGFVPGSRYVKAYHETDAGVPYIHLLEPRLTRGARSSGS